MQTIFSITLLLAFLILSLAIGLKMMRLLKINGLRLSEYYLLGFALGMGIISISMFIIGSTGCLTKHTVWTLFLISLVYFCTSEYTNIILSLKRIVRLLYDLRGAYLIAVVAIFLTYAAWNFFVCLTPVINGDSLAAYLYVPKLYVERGAIYPIKWMIWDDFPLGVHMLNTFGLIIDSDILAQLISGWLMGIMNFLAVYALSRNFVGKGISLLASIAFYTIPAISWLIYSTKIDMGFSFYELSFWVVFFSWIRTKRLSLLYISAVVLGFAIGSKYHGLIALWCSAIVVLVVLLISKHSIHEVLKIATIFCLLAILIGSPSYIKNAIFVQDPVHPYLREPDFGSEEQRNPYTSAFEYIRFQWNIFSGLEFNGRKSEITNKPIGVIPLLLLPFALYGIGRLRKTEKSIALIMLGYYLVISVIMFVSVWPYPRHMLPAIGLLFSLVANGMNVLLVSKYREQVKFMSVILLVIIIVPNNGLPVGSRSIHRFGEQLRYICGKIDKQEYLKRVLFDVPGSVHMNSGMLDYVSTLSPQTRILTLDYGNGYYVPRPLVKRPHYMFSTQSLTQLQDKMKVDMITHIYYSENSLAEIEKRHHKRSIIHTLCREPNFLNLEYKSEDQLLFKVNW